MIAKYECLYKFLERQKFRKISIINDGNCEVRVLAFNLLGDEDKYDTVRQSICDFKVKEYSKEIETISSLEEKNSMLEEYTNKINHCR